MSSQIPKYSRLLSKLSGDANDTEDEDREAVALLNRTRCPQCRTWNPKFLIATALNLVFFVISCSLSSWYYYETRWRLNSAVRSANTYSPVYDMLDLEMKPQTLNGTLFPPKEPSMGRQMPNPEADEIWEEYELTRYVPVTAAQIRAMGKDPSTAAKLEDEDWGLGDDAYAAIFDVYHQIHCVNTLRRIAYGTYYNESIASIHRDNVKEEMYEHHINHCVDMLMQTLQCSGNLNLIVMNWVAEQEYPFPDMSINKQCIDFEKLTKWRLENTLDLDEYIAKMKKKDGVTELPAPDDFYKYYRPDLVNPNHLNGANAGNDFNL